jgi:competence ComEA-like helix-hairpin-helix protein
MSWKEFVTDYLTLSRNERIGIMVIACLILGIFILPKTISYTNNPTASTIDTAWMNSLKKLEQKESENSLTFQDLNNDNTNSYQYDRSTPDYSRKSKGELFFFDPNTITESEWLRLGLREKTFSTIQNYKSKGGYFRTPEDLQKVYGLFPNEYERIAPYIRIESRIEKNNNKEFTTQINTENPNKKTFPSRYTIVDINSADTTALIQLPGIGSKLASRIILFRDKLGGFYTINQVGETFGLPDSTFQKIKQYLKLENVAIRKININKATVDELKNHPYIRWNIANPLIAYRNEHGTFARVEDIKKVMAITDEVYNKIASYLTTQ